MIRSGVRCLPILILGSLLAAPSISGAEVESSTAPSNATRGDSTPDDSIPGDRVVYQTRGYAGAPGSWAVLFAAERYFQLPACPNARRDMQKLKERLLVLGFSEEQVLCLSDDAKQPKLLPFKANFDAQTALVCNQAKPSDLVLIVVKARGSVTGGLPYFLPVTATDADRAASEDRRDVDRIDVRTFLKTMCRCSATRILVVLDLCGDQRSEDNADPSTPEAILHAIGDLPPNITVLVGVSRYGHGMTSPRDDFSFLQVAADALPSPYASPSASPVEGAGGAISAGSWLRACRETMQQRSLSPLPDSRGQLGTELIRIARVPDAQQAEASRLLELGDQHREAGKWPQAIEAYSQAIAANPYDARIYLSRAGIYCLLHDYTHALNDYRKAGRRLSLLVAVESAAVTTRSGPGFVVYSGQQVEVTRVEPGRLWVHAVDGNDTQQGWIASDSFSIPQRQSEPY